MSGLPFALSLALDREPQVPVMSSNWPMNHGVTSLLCPSAFRQQGETGGFFLPIGIRNSSTVGRQGEGKRKRCLIVAITSVFLTAAVTRPSCHGGGTVPHHCRGTHNPCLSCPLLCLPLSCLQVHGWSLLSQSNHLRGTSPQPLED